MQAGAITNEEYVIYQFGFQIGLEMCSCFLICFLIAYYINEIPSFIVSTLCFILLRTFSGGVHLSKYRYCFVCSVVVQTAILLINKQYQISVYISWGILVAVSILVFIFSPVQNINRSLEHEEVKYCRKIILYVLVGLIVFSCVNTLIGKIEYVSLISITVMVVLVSQVLGIIKYQLDIRNGKFLQQP